VTQFNKENPTSSKDRIKGIISSKLAPVLALTTPRHTPKNSGRVAGDREGNSQSQGLGASISRRETNTPALAEVTGRSDVESTLPVGTSVKEWED
jgi:hypothetical protein